MQEGVAAVWSTAKWQAFDNKVVVMGAARSVSLIPKLSLDCFLMLLSLVADLAIFLARRVIFVKRAASCDCWS